MFSKRIFSAVLCISTVLLLSPEARAGFDWTPSPAAQKAGQKAGMHTRVVTPQSDAAGPLTPELDALPPPVPSAPVESVQSQDLPAAQPPLESEPVVLTDEQPAETETLPVPAEEKSSAVQAVPPVTPSVVSGGPVLEGFGSNISLALALRDIVPADYAYAFDNPADAGLKVSWRGGKVWQDVLADALAPHNLAFSVEGAAVRIHLADLVSAQPEEQPQSLVSTTPQEEEVASDASPSSMPVIKESLIKEWTARPGETLRNVVESWGKTAGVDVEWMTPYDYPIESPFRFKGTFDEAITSLLAHYSRETPRPRGRLYPNLPTGPSVLMVN